MDRADVNGEASWVVTPYEDIPAAKTTRAFPPGSIIIPCGMLSRYSVFPICLTGLHLPVGTTVEWGLGINVASNLNQAIARTTGAWVFLMGDDHLFASDILLRLLAHQVPIVSPVCLRRMPPYSALAYRRQLPDGRGEEWPMDELPTSGLHQVYWASASGLLIRRDVLETIPYPWFEVGQIRTDELGEDVYFARKAAAAGIPWYLDCETVIGHITPTCLWPTATEKGWDITLDPTCTIPTPGVPICP